MADEALRPIDGTVTITVSSGEHGNVDVNIKVTGNLSTFELLGVLDVAKDQTINRKREDAFYAHLPKREI